MASAKGLLVAVIFFVGILVVCASMGMPSVATITIAGTVAAYLALFMIWGVLETSLEEIKKLRSDIQNLSTQIKGNSSTQNKKPS